MLSVCPLKHRHNRNLGPTGGTFPRLMVWKGSTPDGNPLTLQEKPRRQIPAQGRGRRMKTRPSTAPGPQGQGDTGAREIKQPSQVFVHPRPPSPQDQLESILQIPWKRNIHILSQGPFLLLCESVCQNSALWILGLDNPSWWGLPCAL